MRRTPALLAFLLVAGASLRAGARPLAQPRDTPRQQVAGEVTADPSLGMELSYTHRWLGLGRASQLGIGAWLGFPFATFGDGRTFDVGVGAAWQLPLWRGLGLTTHGALDLVTARNPHADLVGLGVELGVLPGWYARRWYVAGELTYDPTLTTHVTHRAAAKAAFEDRYPDAPGTESGPRDGWYRGASHQLRAGMVAGGLVRGRVAFYGGAGFEHTFNDLGIVSFADVGILPFYGNAGVAVAF